MAPGGFLLPLITSGLSYAVFLLVLPDVWRWLSFWSFVSAARESPFSYHNWVLMNHSFEISSKDAVEISSPSYSFLSASSKAAAVTLLSSNSLGGSRAVGLGSHQLLIRINLDALAMVEGV
ncbi:hypothetical protein Bca101_043320 [Brassica carinata]